MKTVPITSIADLWSIFDQYGAHWIFRGQSNSNGVIWPIESSLERLVKNTGWDGELAKRMENYSFDSFKSKAHHHLSFDIIPKTKLGWLSLMQHHGVPTKLLDFTSSPFVALFFACSGVVEKQSLPVSVWGLDFRHVLKISISVIKSKNVNFSYNYPILTSKQDCIFQKYIDNKNTDIAWIAEPSQMNLRLAKQQGTFLLSANTERRIWDVLNSSIYQSTSDYLVRIDVPVCLCHDIRNRLNRMNLNNQNLYCDIDGLSKDINSELQDIARLQRSTNNFITGMLGGDGI